MSAALEPAGDGRKALDVLRDQIAPAATDEELLYLAQVGQRLGLDPIAGHVVLISRWDSRLDRNVARPQVTADGRLVLAEATGELDGFDGPEWCGPRNKTGGHDWVEVWDDDDPPHAARVLVYRKGRAHPANGTVRWIEFAQKDRGGNLLPTWAAMPSHMLGKVALNLGLRRAFPGIVPGGLDA
ncbi:MAG TPA: recombinase RecT, partial [Acidimicrobiales bacterium]|nr:recombinase RecT [Acidimicrobiales bacterium]